jgi:hypothetical protein
LIHDESIITTSRRQGKTREGMSEESPSAKLRAYEQKRHRRPSRRGELAQDNETQWFARHGKWRGCAATVHVLIWGGLSDVRCNLHSVGVSNDIGDQAEVTRRSEQRLQSISAGGIEEQSAAMIAAQNHVIDPARNRHASTSWRPSRNSGNEWMLKRSTLAARRSVRELAEAPKSHN